MQGKSVGARTSLAQGVGAHCFRRHPWQEAFLLLLGGPTQQRIVHQRVLDVDDHAGRRVHSGQLFDGKYRLEELGSASAILLGNLDAHQTELEELVDEVFVEDALLIHLLHQGTDSFVGKLADVIAEENFVFGQRRERCRSWTLQNGFRHMIP